MYGDERVNKLGQANQAQYGGVGVANACSPTPMTEAACDQGYSAEPLRRSPVRERVYRALHDGQRAIRRLQAAERASQIIEQHPEFAELLDALDQL